MNQDLIEEVLACPDLPSLPVVAAQVIELTSRPDVSMDELARTIMADQGLASRILRTVNSSFFGLRQQCASIEKALVLLGLGPVKSLVLGFSLVKCVGGDDDSEFDYVSYWRRGLYAAVGARCFAEAIRFNRPDEVFLAGLLQDVGMIALLRAIGPRYVQVVAMTDGDHASLVKHELETLGVQHPEIGALLAERWKLPVELTIPVKYHERPSAGPTEYADAIRCVALGNYIHDALTDEDPQQALRSLYRHGEAWFGLSCDAVDAELERAGKAVEEVRKAFGLDTGAAPDVEALLAQADRQVIQLMKEEPQSQYPEEGLRSLLIGTDDQDPLTGAIGRSGFDASLRAAFDEAQNDHNSLSLVQVYAEGLEEVLADRGQAQQDEVVIGLVALLHRHFDPMGAVVCRLGDSMFAVVLPGVERRAAVRVAEDFRQQTPISITHWLELGSGEAVPVRVSIGVATIDEQTAKALGRPELLVKATARGLQGARQTGGDCVRAFVPRKAA